MTAYSGCEGTDGGSNKHSMSSTHTLWRYKDINGDRMKMMMIPHIFLQITKSTVITIEKRTRYRPAFSRVDKVKGAIREAGNAEG